MADNEQAENTATAPAETVKEVEVKGYKFNVDTDLLDDIRTLDLINEIENKKNITAIVPLLKLILGEAAFSKMEAHFIAEDAKEHEGKEGYVPRFRMTLLTPIYMAIIAKFDPKG